MTAPQTPDPENDWQADFVPDPRTPATEAGRRHLQWLLAGDDVFEDDARATVLAIEAEARADALREAAERSEHVVRVAYQTGGSREAVRAAVLAILDPQP